MAAKRLKIGFLSRYLGSVDRGVETHVIELSKRLSANFDVKVFSGKNADSLDKIFKEKFDVVIPTNGRLQALKVSLGRISGKYKVLITGHAGIGKDEIWNIFITAPDVYVALTDYELNWAKKWAWKTKLVKIPNGVDLNKFSPSGKKIKFDLPGPIILSVGALEWYKHHELVIDAVSHLSEGSLVIVGSGSKKDELATLANKKIPGRFKIISASFDEMADIYRSADIFTLPSWDREAFGIVYVEAMASGLPVVAPNDSPRREIIGEAGVFVDVEDSEKYAQVIDNALSKDWGNKPRQQAEKFSWDLVANQYKKIIEELFG